MIKLEKFFFWLTVATFALPLTVMLGDTYRLNLFELPLWCLCFLCFFRFGLRDQKLHLTRLDFYFIAFLIWLALSLSFNDSWGRSWNHWFFWIKCGLLGFYLRHNLYRHYSPGKVVNVLIIMLFVEATLGLIQGVTQSSFGAIQQYFGQEVDHTSVFDTKFMRVVRVQGTFKQSNILGNWIVFLLPLALARALTASGRARWFYWLTSVVALIALVATLSRGNWGAAVFGLLIMSYATGVLAFKRLNWARIAFVTGLVAVYLVSLVVTYYDELAVMVEILAARVEILPGSRSSNVRLNTMLAAFELIEENPVWGVGLGNSNQLLHFTEYDIRDRFQATVHNIFLIICSEGGFVACLLFLLILWQPLKNIFRLARMRRGQVKEEIIIIASGMLGGYSSIVFAMLWYTTMLDSSQLPLILMFVNLAIAIRPEKLSPATLSVNGASGEVMAPGRLQTLTLSQMR